MNAAGSVTQLWRPRGTVYARTAIVLERAPIPGQPVQAFLPRGGVMERLYLSASSRPRRRARRT
jgi:hypothetical protein